MPLPAKPCVLIVDASRESREILRTMLHNRLETEILETSELQTARHIAQQQKLDLIVCDADGDRSPASEATRDLALEASRSNIPIVVLGTVGRKLCPLVGGGVVSKPYHYGPLIRKIESLLEPRV